MTAPGVPSPAGFGGSSCCVQGWLLCPSYLYQALQDTMTFSKETSLSGLLPFQAQPGPQRTGGLRMEGWRDGEEGLGAFPEPSWPFFF